jgi:hypothetical protein
MVHGLMLIAREGPTFLELVAGVFVPTVIALALIGLALHRADRRR